MKAPEIFKNAVQIEDETQRATYVETACEGDTELRNEILLLIELHFSDGRLHLSDEERPTEDLLGTTIDEYRILEVIGEGGFGTVFRAEQTEPVRREVALKVLRPERNTKKLVSRFEIERQALALISHPNVAQVYGGGTTPGGLPYLCMELVSGLPIAEYYKQNDLSLDKRLELFAQVCRAVQHAHTKGIIHRDLKPSNILITSQDGVPVPKVIDFGIAKVIDNQSVAATLVTGLHQLIGTPHYMSPEQLSFGSNEIDTRSDVYSLGVILFEMLTGERPFHGDLQLLLKQVQDQSVPRLRKLNSRIPPDLETITLKCLEKSPDDRYQSPSELNDELRRFREGKPIQARNVSSMEVAWRWCRRNPVIAGLTSLSALLLLSVAFVSTTAYRNQVQKIDELRRAKYGSDLKAAFARAEKSLQGSLIQQTLRNSHPHVAKVDLRGWEWYLLNSYLHRDVAVLRGHLGTAEDVAWSADGSLLTSVGGNGEIIIWDGSKHAAVRTIEDAHDGLIWCVAWHPKKPIFATGGSDGFVRVWDEGGTEIAKFLHEMPADDIPTGSMPSPVRHLIWRPSDGMLITGDDSCKVRFWDVEQEKQVKVILAERYSSDSNGVLGIDWSSKHGLVTSADNSNIRRWNRGETEFVDSGLAGMADDRHFIAWQPQGDLLAFGGKARDVAIWNKATNEVEHMLPARHFLLDGEWHSEEPLLAVCGNDAAVRVWDHDAKQERVYVGHGAPVLGVAWRPKTLELASAGQDGSVRIWSMDAPELIQEYSAETASWNSDGSKLA